MLRNRFLALVAALAALTPLAARADGGYTLRTLVTRGDRVGEMQTGSLFGVGALDDRGRLVFVTDIRGTNRHMLVQYADGKLLPLVVSGGERPGGGNWPRDVRFWLPVSMNQHGNVVFDAFPASLVPLGVFLWNAADRQVTPMALPGTPAVNDTAFAEAGGYLPVINNLGEAAFAGRLTDPTGRKEEQGLFFRAIDGRLQVVVLPEQKLPGSRRVNRATTPSLDDRGRVAFIAATHSIGQGGAYLWDQGTLTPIAAVGGRTADGNTIERVLGAVLNNRDLGAWVMARVQEDKANRNGERPDRLYRWAESTLTSVAVVGQEMPGGGTFQDVERIGYATEAGQLPFTAFVSEGGRAYRACYLAEAEGKLSLVCKEGQTTELGRIASIGGSAGWLGGIAANSRGEVAVPVQFAGGIDRIVLLTPTAP